MHSSRYPFVLALGLLSLVGATPAGLAGEGEPPPPPPPAAADAAEEEALRRAEEALKEAEALRARAAALELEARAKEQEARGRERDAVRARRREVEDRIREVEDDLALARGDGRSAAEIGALEGELRTLYANSVRLTTELSFPEMRPGRGVGGATPARSPRTPVEKAAYLATEGLSPLSTPAGRTPTEVVEGGLAWLAAHQSETGAWDADGFHARCRDGRCPGAGSPLYDPGVTGLALLPFLGYGETHKSPKYGAVVRNGLKYLKSIQDAEGCFGPKVSSHYIYNHALATLAMSEAYGLTQSPLFKGSAQAGVDFLVRAQNPYLGWRYGERPGDNDTSVTGWCVMALKSAKQAGLQVDEVVFQGAKTWIAKVTDPVTGRIGYTAMGNGPARPVEWMDEFPSDKSEALTAEGGVALLLCGMEATDPAVTKAMDLVLANPPLPEAERFDLIALYFGTTLAHRKDQATWRTWCEKVLVPWYRAQRIEVDGCARGSFDPVGPWGPEGGRVYSTALAVMAVERTFGYRRVGNDGEGR